LLAELGDEYPPMSTYVERKSVDYRFVDEQYIQKQHRNDYPIAPRISTKASLESVNKWKNAALVIAFFFLFHD
jgi:hypothetical protein